MTTIIGKEGLRRNVGKGIVYPNDRRYIGHLAHDDRRGFYVESTLDSKCRKLLREDDQIGLLVSDGHGGVVFRRYQVKFSSHDYFVPDMDSG